MSFGTNIAKGIGILVMEDLESHLLGTDRAWDIELLDDTDNIVAPATLNVIGRWFFVGLNQEDPMGFYWDLNAQELEFGPAGSNWGTIERVMFSCDWPENSDQSKVHLWTLPLATPVTIEENQGLRLTKVRATPVRGSVLIAAG